MNEVNKLKLITFILLKQTQTPHMKRWNVLTNSFLVITHKRFVLCQQLADYTLAALNVDASNAFLHGLYVGFQPIVADFTTHYIDWKSQQSRLKGKTKQLTIDLKLLQSEKIVEWDIAIQNQYKQKTSDYKSLLPHRRKKFQRGSQEDRLNAVITLSQLLQNYPSLSTVKTDVDAFYTILKKDFDIQKTNKGGSKSINNLVENARKTVCVELYGILALLIHHHKDNPQLAQKYFDIENIHQQNQTNYRGNLKPAQQKHILTHTFAEGDTLKLQNKGVTTLRFSLRHSANDPLANTFVELAPATDMIVNIAQLGNLENRFLFVENNDTQTQGRFMLKRL